MLPTQHASALTARICMLYRDVLDVTHYILGYTIAFVWYNLGYPIYLWYGCIVHDCSLIHQPYLLTLEAPGTMCVLLGHCCSSSAGLPVHSRVPLKPKPQVRCRHFKVHLVFLSTFKVLELPARGPMNQFLTSSTCRLLCCPWLPST